MMKEQPTADARGTGGAPFTEPPRESAPPKRNITEFRGTLATLLRQEAKLAEVEVSVSASMARRSAGYAGAAGVAGHFVLLVLSLGSAAALAVWTGHGIAALVVAVTWMVTESALVVLSRKKLARARGTPGTAPPARKKTKDLNPTAEEHGSGAADAHSRRLGNGRGNPG